MLYFLTVLDLKDIMLKKENNIEKGKERSATKKRNFRFPLQHSIIVPFKCICYVLKIKENKFILAFNVKSGRQDMEPLGKCPYSFCTHT